MLEGGSSFLLGVVLLHTITSRRLYASPCSTFAHVYYYFTKVEFHEIDILQRSL